VHSAPVPVHDTADSWLEVVPFGAGTCCRVQVLPSQDSAKEAVPDAPEYEPTALQDPSITQDKLESELDVEPAGCGMVCTVHAEPFQPSASGNPPEFPTASHSVEAAQETPSRTEFPVSTGVGSTDQAVPFQTRAIVA
jgi:hypothetical protein